MRAFIRVAVGAAILASWAASAASAQPNTVKSPSGNVAPAPGYSWVSPAAEDYRVKWTPGKVHSDEFPHVVAGASEGKFIPAPGYAWLNKTPDDLRVKWTPGTVHSDEFPHVVAGAKEGTFNPAPGYTWLNNTPGDLRTVATRSSGSARAAELFPRTQQVALIASAVSADHYDQRQIVLEASRGGRQTVRLPFPPLAEPDRMELMRKEFPKVTDPSLVAVADAAVRVQLQYEFDCRVIAAAVTSRRMDAAFLKEQAERWRDAFQVDGNDLFLRALGDRRITDPFTTDLYRTFFKQLAETYAVGLAQTLRERMAAYRQEQFQRLWADHVLPEVMKGERKKVEPALVVVGRTQVVEQTGVGAAILWAGLVAKNGAKTNLTNVCLDLSLKGPGGKAIRRTYFFPRLRADQAMILPIDDREWGTAIGLAATADRLQAELLVVCDEGVQPQQTFVLAKPSSNRHLDFVAGQAASADDLKVAAGAEMVFRELAKKQRSITLVGIPRGPAGGGDTARFFGADGTIEESWGVAVVDVKQFLRVTLSEAANPQSTVDLDGYFDSSMPGQTRLELFSHGNLNALDQRLKGLDRNYGTLTFKEGKYSLQFQGVRFTSKE